MPAPFKNFFSLNFPLDVNKICNLHKFRKFSITESDAVDCCAKIFIAVFIDDKFIVIAVS